MEERPPGPVGGAAPLTVMMDAGLSPAPVCCKLETGASGRGGLRVQVVPLVPLTVSLNLLAEGVA